MTLQTVLNQRKSNFFYPEKGLGAAVNQQRVSSVCQSTRNSGGILDIWVCVNGQGVAYYTYEGGKPSGVEEIGIADGDLIYNGETVALVGADAKQIAIFSTSGSLVANVIEVNEVCICNLSKGIYIVRAVAGNGSVLTRKIIKR